MCERGKMLCKLALNQTSRPYLRPREKRTNSQDNSDSEEVDDSDDDPWWSPSPSDPELTISDTDSFSLPITSPLTAEQADVARSAERMIINIGGWDIEEPVAKEPVLLEETNTIETSQGNESCEVVMKNPNPLPHGNKDHDFEVSGRSAEAQESDISSLFVALSKRNPKRIWDKKDHCIFCEKMVTNFTRHLTRIHSEEIQVGKVLALPKGSKDRRAMFESLRRKGNFYHNTNCIREESGALIVVQRPTKQKNVSHYLPCKMCLGFFSKDRLYRHMANCKQKGEFDNGKNAQSMGAALLFVNPTCNEELKNAIFTTMRHDNVSKAVKEDSLICEFGLRLLKHHQESHMKNVISQKMRELGRLKLELQSKISTKAKAGLEEFLDPDLYNTVVQCVQSVSGFQSDTGKFHTPSLAQKLGYSLKHCCEILECKGIMLGNETLRKRAKRFLQLLPKMWRYDVSINASKTLKEGKFNKPRILPLAEDIKKLHDYIVSNESKLSNELKLNPSETVWRGLAEVSLTHIILLNRRRSGEAQRILLSDYFSIDANKSVDSTSDSNQLLSEVEKKMCKSFSRFEIRGKRGRGVPVLLTSQMKINLDLLVQTREKCNVLPENPYLFPIPNTTSSSIRGPDVMRNHAKLCGAKLPDNIRSTTLRKQVATMSQLLNITENDVQGLATFMGHNVDVHKEYYRLPDNVLQVAKISKLLLALESGKLEEIKGKNFDNMNIDEPVSDDECNKGNEDTCNTEQYYEQHSNITTLPIQDVPGVSGEKYIERKGKKYVKKVPWSPQEKDALNNHFKKHILLKKVPNKDESMKCLKENPCLSNRSWSHIKFAVKNMFNKS